MTVFRRLMGLETEYAIRYRPADPAMEPPTQYRLFRRFLECLRTTLPTAEAASDKPGRFLATGGAVEFERFWQARQSGLIEGATPECRSPRDLLVWQRAQDRMFSEVARHAGEPSGEFVLLKNNRDSRGRTYGSHENYEATLATGPSLFFWRAGLILLLPVAALQMVLLVIALLVVFLLFWTTATFVWAILSALSRARGKSPTPLSRFVGEGLIADDEHAAPWPPWFDWVVMAFVIGVLLPVVFGVMLLLRLTAFRRQRKMLLPFLITRCVFSGAGWIDPEGRYQLTQKMSAINHVNGLYAPFDRPVYNFGHLLEMIIVLPFTPKIIPRLMRPRQRIQICHGDSNRCEEAEYLKLATTSLLLDVIEQGGLQKVPRLWPPVRHMRMISRDTSLTKIVATYRGRKLTAVDVQRFYCNACRSFVNQLPDPPPEAQDVLDRWEDVLDRLESDRESLVGRVDWITKEFILNSVGDNLSSDSRKMIDLRYHEVSPQGYYDQLAQTEAVHRVVSDDEIAHAMRNAPPATPAAVRGRYIREFADGDVPLSVNWFRVQLGSGKESRVIDLQPPPQNDKNDVS